MKDIILKNARVVYASIKTPYRFEKADPRYTLSLLVEVGDENYKAFTNAVKEVFKDNSVKGAKAKELFDQKVKAIPEKAEEYIDDLNDKHRLISLTSKKQPKVYFLEDGELVVDSEQRVFPGAVINVKARIMYTTVYKKLMTQPLKISIVALSQTFDSDFDNGDDDDGDWLAANNIEKSDSPLTDIPAKKRAIKEESVEEESFDF